MFSKQKTRDKSNTLSVADKVSIIAAGMQLTGDIESEGDIRIDGVVTGNVYCKAKVVIISSGKLIGDVQAVNVDVHGTVIGNITARDLLCLKAKCNISGNLTTDKLQIEPNAIFNGSCTMKSENASLSIVNEEGVLFHND